MVLVNDNHILDNAVKINQNGFAVFNDVPIANSGNIQEYAQFELGNLPEHLQHKETIRIYRPAKEVKKSISTFNYLPVTNGHPFDDISTRNYKEYGIGISDDVKFKKNHVVSRSIVIVDSDMIVELQSNSESLELSCGYMAEFVYEAGVTDGGEAYDGFMKNLKGNHIAVVERGRCGGTCRLWE